MSFRSWVGRWDCRANVFIVANQTGYKNQPSPPTPSTLTLRTRARCPTRLTCRCGRCLTRRQSAGVLDSVVKAYTQTCTRASRLPRVAQRRGEPAGKGGVAVGGRVVCEGFVRRVRRC
jgi:hypothetical protein